MAETKIIEEKNKLMEERKMMNLYLDSEDTPEQLLEKTKLAENIYQNLGNMSTEIIQENLLKIVSKRKILREFFKFELDYYQPTEKCKDKDELKNKILKLFSRYQMTLDTGIEDEDWRIHNSASPEFKIPQHEIWFENSVSHDKEEDDSLIDFLTKIKAKIEKLYDAMTVKYKIIPHRNACIVLLKCIFKKKLKKKKHKTKNSVELKNKIGDN